MREKPDVHDIGRPQCGFPSIRKADFFALSKARSAMRVAAAVGDSEAGAAFVDLVRKTGSYTRQQLVGDRFDLAQPTSHCR